MKLGILGTGQLAKMLAIAAHELDVEPHVFGPDELACGTRVAKHTLGQLDDRDAVARFVESVDVTTYELEGIDASATAAAAARGEIHPPADAARITQDRLLEKQLLEGLGVGVATFRAVDDPASLGHAVGDLGLPALLKSRRGGYDGKGQKWLRTEQDAPRLEADATADTVLEQAVVFRRELSQVAVRSSRGETRFYPLVESRHHAGILRVTRTLDEPDPELEAEARGIATRVLDALDYVGVLAVELFDTDTGLLVNELAPRVHNTGHWTQTGAVTSQFENHVRAVLGMPLGTTDALGACAMVNVIGDLPNATEVLEVEGTRLFLYGKAPKPGRKLGHVDVIAESAAVLDERIARVRSVVERSDAGRE